MAKKNFEAKRREPDDESLGLPTNFYANAAYVMSSVYDVTLQFRTQTPIALPAENQPLVLETRDICNVRMSPQQAKALVAILAKHIMGYEQDHKVKLPLPPDMQNIWNEVFKA